MGIKHRADGGFRKFRVLSKHCLGGQVRSSKCPTFHTRDRCGTILHRLQKIFSPEDNVKRLYLVSDAEKL